MQETSQPSPPEADGQPGGVPGPITFVPAAVSPKKRGVAGMVTDENYMWWAAVPVVLGMFIVIMDSSIVNVALSHIMNDFGSNVEDIEWVSTGYMLSSAVMMPTTGFLGDRFGRKRVYVAAIALFTIASMLCGAAWSAESLIFFRVLQGLVGGAIQPVAQAILFEAFPPAKRGTSQALVGMGAMFAPMIGPTVGGYLVDYASWRSIFYVNLPFGIIATLMAIWVLREGKTRSVKFDYIGFILMATFLSTGLLGLSQGNTDGWGSDYIISLFAVSLLTFCGFLLSAFWVREPVVSIDLLKYRTYAAGIVASMVMGVGLFGGMFLLPLFLQGLMGYEAIEAGLLMMPQGLAAGLVMATSSTLFKKVDPRILMSVGLGLMGTSLILQSHMEINTPLRSIIEWTIMRGLGMGLAFPAMNQMALGSIPVSRIGQASGLFNVMRQIGGSVGIAVLSTLLVQRTIFHASIMGQDAMRTGMLGHIISTVGGLALRQGANPLMATAQASAAVTQQVMNQISVLAYQDTFFFAGIVGLCGIIPALIMQPPKHTDHGEAGAALAME